MTSLIGGRLFREDLSPAKETWFDMIDLFTPTGKILVNLGQSRCALFFPVHLLIIVLSLSLDLQLVKR